MSAELSAFLQSHGILHFSCSEVCAAGRRCEGATLLSAPRDLWANAILTLRVLEWLRRQVGPIRVHSGYRDPAYNKAVGGARRSLHVVFNAFDISCKDTTPEEIYAILEAHRDAPRFGLGLYSNFVHIDTRGFLGRVAPSRWTRWSLE